MQRVITGRLATDPETDRVGAARNHPRTTLIVFENTGRRNREGAWVEDPEPTRHTIKAWGDLGLQAAELRRGDAVIVVGHERTEAWTDRESDERRRRRVIEADHIGPDMRWMDVNAQRRQRPNLDEQAMKSWQEHGLNAPKPETITTRTLTEAEQQAMANALDEAAVTAEAMATEQTLTNHGLLSTIDTAMLLRDLFGLIVSARDITLHYSDTDPEAPAP